MNKLLLTLAFVVLTVSFLATPKSASATYFNPCQFDVLHLIKSCWPTPSPSSTPSPTPTVSPTPTSTPCDFWKDGIQGPCMSASPEPTATPSATPTETHFSLGGPAYAPTQPLCGAVPVWAPTVSYDGQVGNTFNYHWTTVMDGLHTYWVDYGFTKDFLPYSLVVHGEKASITMFGGNSNWVRIAGYVEPGCFGPWSQTVN